MLGETTFPLFHHSSPPQILTLIGQYVFTSFRSLSLRLDIYVLLKNGDTQEPTTYSFEFPQEMEIHILKENVIEDLKLMNPYYNFQQSIPRYV